MLGGVGRRHLEEVRIGAIGQNMRRGGQEGRENSLVGLGPCHQADAPDHLKCISSSQTSDLQNAVRVVCHVSLHRECEGEG